MADDFQLWWRAGVIYQIYPRSFADTDADGVGDLRGIEQHLDYLGTLGIAAIWISPIYPSPMADFGYDVADYTGIDPLFGTMAEFDSLLAAAHARSLHVILDFVPNHTSDQHPWFLESRASLSSPRRDWYLWRDEGTDSSLDRVEGHLVPNNWKSNFGGPAWTWDPTTGQFFYHSFLPQQPDLNWRNPAVHDAMFAALRFWLDKGVDGFRMDVLWLLIKDGQFRDNPPNPDYTGGNTLWSVLPRYTADQPETLAIVAEMRSLLDSYGSAADGTSAGSARVLIGEIYLPIPDLVRYYGAPAPSLAPPTDAPPHLTGAQLPFNFHLIQTAWQAPLIAALITAYEAALPAGAWPNYVLGNHDQKRLSSRIGPAQARVAAMLLLTLRGTPTLYNGDELGMPDATIAPAQVRDPAELRQPGIGQGRDPERSPMLWDASPNAGFTTATAQPWLPLIDSWQTHTVAAETADPHSFLALYRALLALRRAQPALHSGIITAIRSENGVLSFSRAAAPGTSAAMSGDAFEIHLNLTDAPEITHCSPGKLVLNTALDQTHADVGGTLGLRPNEGIVIHLTS